MLLREKTVREITLYVNGREYNLPVGEGKHFVHSSETLAYTLRERLELTGLKIGCDRGVCGSCTVVMDGDAVSSCMILTVDCEDRNITTIEGLTDPDTGDLSKLQQSFVERTGYQCGFCTPGIIMAAKALLDKNSHPTEEEVREALAGNYCRCGTHYTAVESIMAHIHEGEDSL
ncbi:MAG: (2Fe-2S)-binding protein [Synergistaceae bacterium]|jgi:carbon-monoxide dehydrogenase small subunit|nr:(2Fe-2S)-binding protein [Synergistaceae bacterium]